MPEGPEVKAYAESLKCLLAGNSLSDIKIISGRYIKKTPKSFLDIKSKLPLKIRSVSCKGKFLYITLEDGSYVWNTLGMAGVWSDMPIGHTRIIFETHNDEGQVIRAFYGDVRNFGTFKFCMSKEETEHKLNSLGNDFLLGEVIFDSRIFNSDKTLAELLMDQRNYAGVGNYIKSEALYRARLSPHRTGKSLSEQERATMHTSIKKIMISSYNCKRITFNQSAICGSEFEKIVYKKKFDPIGNRIKSESTKDGRTTYWVPEIQS